MGYYTRFVGGVSGPVAAMEEFYNDLRLGGKFSSYQLGLDFWTDSGDYDTMKWYDWKDDVNNFSLSYPDLTFTIEGEGEEQPDMWKSWTRNGVTVVVQGVVTFPEPDLSALPPVDPNRSYKRQLEKLESEKKKIENKIDELKSSTPA